MNKSDYFPDSKFEEVCDFFDVVPGDFFSLRFKSNTVLRVVILSPKRYDDLHYKGLE